MFFEAFKIRLVDAGGLPWRGLTFEHTGIDARFHRDPDDHVRVCDARLASQPVSLGLVVHTDTIRKAAIHMAFFDENTTFGAYPIAPAGRIDVHTGFHGGAQQALSFGNCNRFFMGQKGYTGHSQLLHDNGCFKVAFIKTARQRRFLSYTCSSSFKVSKRQLNVSISPS